MVLYAGLVVWFATYVLVESELFRPLREWIGHRELAAERKAPTYYAEDGFSEFVPTWRTRLWGKLSYLVGCHTCTGTWVGFAVAAAVPSVRPLGGGVVGFVLAGLLFKAVGHLALVVHKAGERLAGA